jgi:tRNA pseudouridine55 synthase
MNGLLLLNKPEGITSFHAIDLIKKKFKLKKIGHAGTIDSFAGGLLIAGVNEGTKLLPYYLNRDKAYRTIFKLGITTDTHDPKGQTISEFEGILPDIDKIKDTISGFKGEIDQIPPAYSAVKINGKRASDRIRLGEEVTIAPRKVKVYSIELLELNGSYVTLAIECSKGTYIRSLARDLGNLLGCGAFVTNLVRTYVDPFSLNQSVGFNELLDADTLENRLISLHDALPFFAKMPVNQKERDDIVQGRPVEGRSDVSGYNILATFNDKALAILKVEKSDNLILLKPERLFSD